MHLHSSNAPMHESAGGEMTTLTAGNQKKVYQQTSLQFGNNSINQKLRTHSKAVAQTMGMGPQYKLCS